eukprot:3362938-Amphidinium_carterae.1
MRGFKNHLAGESAKHFAADILTNTNLHGTVTTKPVLRSQVTNLVNAAATHTQRGAYHIAGWKHLMVSDEEWEETVQYARDLSMEDSQWDKAGFWHDEAPDECPSDVEEEEVADEQEEEEPDVEWLQPPIAVEEESVPTTPAAAMS